jgi:hypothetical protein
VKRAGIAVPVAGEIVFVDSQDLLFMPLCSMLMAGSNLQKNGT